MVCYPGRYVGDCAHTYNLNSLCPRSGNCKPCHLGNGAHVHALDLAVDDSFLEDIYDGAVEYGERRQVYEDM